MLAKLIAVDWGTSSFRAWLMGAEGEILDEVPSGPGILSVPNGDFDQAFEQILASWLGGSDTPIIASGMITSRNGWVETPYLPLPMDADDLSRALTPHKTKSGRKLHFVTGVVRNQEEGLPDVMRGEETEIIGHLSNNGANDGLFVLPGTHSKWATVANGKLIEFKSCMTGEVFALLLKHSILGRLVVEGTVNENSFQRGVEAGGQNGALLSRIFSARTLALVERLEGGDIADYLSGLLIGDEVASMLASVNSGGTVTIIGRGDLAERYLAALSQLGASANIASPGMARAGLWKIAKLAGVIE